MYKLYARKGAGSAAVEAMLAECGASYVIEDIERQADGTMPAGFFKINPRGEVPALELPDRSIMTESAAMLIHLGDTHREALLAPPASSPQRPQYLRWMLFLATTLYMSDLRYFHPKRYSSDAAAASGIRTKAGADMDREFAILAGALGEGPYLLGREFSAIDIYAAMLVNWSPDIGALFGRHANLAACYERVTARPAVTRVWARNGM